MTKVRTNAIVQGLSGTLGKNVVFRQRRDGTIIMSSKPDFSQRIFSTGQLTHQSRFQQAAAYARQAARTQPIYAERAKGTTQTAYNIAVSDWFKPPVIHSIERQAGRILIAASDNVLVTLVTVTILDEAGRMLEQGEAVHGIGSNWEYATDQRGRVIVQAFDLAGNCSSQELSLG